MRKSVVILGIAVVLGAAALVIVSSPFGVSVGGIEVGGTERKWLAERTIDFLEDIQFKDFQRASTYHLDKTQKERNIPELIRRIFQIKHEVLDIKDYKILDVDLDRSTSRARVRALVHYHVLGDQSTRDHLEAMREVEMLFYWFRQTDGTWTMELESSLR
jgi:hypothetical protein